MEASTANTRSKETSASSGAAAAASQQKQSKPLACTACRARKLGCNRVHPCYNCVRSGAECVFPARRRIQRPRKTKNTELLQRLSRLESIVGKAGVENLPPAAAAAAADQDQDQDDGVGASAAQDLHVSSFAPPGTVGSSGSSASAATAAAAAKPRLQSFLEEYRDSHRGGGDGDGRESDPSPQDRASARYLSGQFWANLCGEVEGLRQALEHSTDSDEEEDRDPSEGTSPESAVGAHDECLPVSGGLLPGFMIASGGYGVPPIQHPAPGHIRYLAQVYFDNFDIIVKILHRPTIAAALHRFADAAGDRSLLTPEQEALFFAIYYAAVTTLGPEACPAHLDGQERGELVRRFQAGLERSLARADYLNSASLETLQALAIYLACLRCHSGSRSSWALLSLPVRLAQALSLHRERASRLCSPYETELRRRLWWQLIVLDVRGVEDRGGDPLIARGSYDTRLPLNVNDEDFGPGSPSIAERGVREPTDMTFSLSTAQSSGIFLYLNYMYSGTLGADGDAQPPSEEETIAHAQHLESQFVTGVGEVDPNRHFGAYVASFTVRLIILKLWLITQYPTHQRRDRSNAAVRQRLGKQLATTSDVLNDTEMSGISGHEEGVPNGHIHSNNITITNTTITIHHRADSPSPVNNDTDTTPTPNPNPNPNTITTPTTTTNGVSREATLRTAVSIMELSHHANRTGSIASRFGWWSATYVQWHPLAVALAELCAPARGVGGGEGELADRAWRVVDEVFPLWAERIADTKRGTLWRPIRKLYRKAKAARRAAAAAAAALGGEGGGGGVGGTTTAAAPPTATTVDENGRRIPGLLPRADGDDVPSVCDKTAMPHPLPEATDMPIRGATPPPPLQDLLWVRSPTDEAQPQPQPQPQLTTAPLPADINRLAVSATGWFGDPMVLPDISFDVPDVEGGAAVWDTMDWSAWDEFVNDTHAEGPWTSPSEGS